MQVVLQNESCKHLQWTSGKNKTNARPIIYHLGILRYYLSYMWSVYLFYKCTRAKEDAITRCMNDDWQLWDLGSPLLVSPSICAWIMEWTDRRKRGAVNQKWPAKSSPSIVHVVQGCKLTTKTSVLKCACTKAVTCVFIYLYSCVNCLSSHLLPKSLLLNDIKQSGNVNVSIFFKQNTPGQTAHSANITWHGVSQCNSSYFSTDVWSSISLIPAPIKNKCRLP